MSRPGAQINSDGGAALSTYAVGTKVQAKFADGRWHPATVRAVVGNGVYSVDWADADLNAGDCMTASLAVDPAPVSLYRPAMATDSSGYDSAGACQFGPLTFLPPTSGI
eukprot:gene3780-4181_t